MIVLSIENVPGKNFAAIGAVKGNVVRTKHVGNDIVASLRSPVGGECANTPR